MTDHPNYKARDWRWNHHGVDRTNATGAAISATKCPFDITLEIKDELPAYITANARFLRIGDQGAPTQGYYGTVPGRQGVAALVLITNYLGIWFEVELREGKFVAKRVARPALQLVSDPLPGVEVKGIQESGEALPAPSRQASNAPSRENSQARSEHEDIDMGTSGFPSDQTTRGRRPPFPP